MAKPILYQFPISHYCEIARWALEYKNTDYEVKNLVPGPHRATIRKIAPLTFTPVLSINEDTVQGSVAIIDYLERQTKHPPLTPTDPEAASMAHEWTRFTDKNIGIPLRLIFYFHILPLRKLATHLLTEDGPWWGKPLYAIAFPGIKKVMRNSMKINQQNAVTAERTLFKALDHIAERLRDRKYLVDNSFTRADLCASALLAPLWRPIEDAPTELRTLIATLKKHEAVTWRKEFTRITGILNGAQLNHGLLASLMAESKDKYKLYGMEGSYYAAKARSYFLQKPLPFEEIQVTRQVFDEVLAPRVGFAMVPLVVTPDDETLLDTALIIETLERRYPENPVIPAEPKRRFVAYLLELYADEWLKIPALHYRWHYDSAFAIQMMGETNDPTASFEEQQRVGQKVAALFRTWPAHLGANEQTKHAVEALFIDYLELLEVHFESHRYFLGDAPTLADCAMMGPLYAHLYRDPYSGKILRDRAPYLCDWIARMRCERVAPHKAQQGSIPPTIVEFLQRLSLDYVPTALGAIGELGSCSPVEIGEQLPRYLGEHKFSLGRGTNYETSSKRSIHTVEMWKLQRLSNYFANLTRAEQRDALLLFRTLSAQRLLELNLPFVIDFNNYHFICGTVPEHD